MDGVMLDGDAADITGCDGHTSPVLVGDVIELRLFNGLSATYLPEVHRLVGEMGLQSLW